MRTINLLLFSFILVSVGAALQPCAPGVRCPPNGIWSEWTGSSECKMPCGACAHIFQTRTCLTSSISNCPCVGISSRSIPCNTHGCQYPSQKTCCIPYLPMTQKNGNQTCGPLPKSMRDGGSSCCPVGGLWTPWTGYQKGANGWVSNRMCLSESMGCPCSGDKVRNLGGCPCAQPANADFCNGFNNNQPHYYRNLIIDNDKCVAFLPMVGHNDGVDYCNKWTQYYKPYIFVGLLLMVDDKGTCFKDIVFDCQNGERADRWMNASFSCDTSTMNWVYDWNGRQITAYNQGIYLVQD